MKLSKAKSIFTRRSRRDERQPTATTDSQLDPTTPRTLEGIYQPLDATKREIRLMRMVPDLEGIQCELRAFSLNDKPVFTALSYCWTKEPPTETIVLQGKPFPVRPNLYNYLHARAQEGDASEWIFIDALCINQENVGERSEQVALMGDVYRGAKEVVAWLGNEASMTEEELLTWLEWCDLSADAKQKSRSPGDVRLLGSKFFETFAPPAFWLRVWIVQEIVLARRLLFRCASLFLRAEQLLQGLRRHRRVIYGSDEAEDFLETPRCLYGEEDSCGMILLIQVPSILTIRERARTHPMMLGEAVYLFASQGCSEQYDCVFGLLGMCYTGIHPDYSKPKLEVFLPVLSESYIGMDSLRTSSKLLTEWRLHSGHILWSAEVLLQALELHPKHPLVALILIESVKWSNGFDFGGTFWYRSILSIYYEQKGPSNAPMHRILRLYGWTLSHAVMLGLQVYRLRNSVLHHPDKAPEARTYSEWVEHIREVHWATENVCADICKTLAEEEDNLVEQIGREGRVGTIGP
ncbi:uncharacterized protein LTR77_004123 [Saxophila tyrrhenica]|uniref:Heterokaryon incompatibility domain-containing protein n=1 Tax=Saxophila tyrrhenica TaxID=1690608 RepID=A0AAV9PEE2_9PEZI|nr:hypothetical protein LTR77_004123 [Saxophila tyrrhenica]